MDGHWIQDAMLEFSPKKSLDRANNLLRIRLAKNQAKGVFGGRLGGE